MPVNHFRIIGDFLIKYDSQALLLPDWSPLSLFVVFMSGNLQTSKQNANSYCVLCTVQSKTCELNEKLQAIHYALWNHSIATAHTRLPGTATCRIFESCNKGSFFPLVSTLVQFRKNRLLITPSVKTNTMKPSYIGAVLGNLWLRECREAISVRSFIKIMQAS